MARVLKLRNLLLPQFHTGAPDLGPGVVQAWPFLPQVSRLPVVQFWSRESFLHLISEAGGQQGTGFPSVRVGPTAPSTRVLRLLICPVT